MFEIVEQRKLLLKSPSSLQNYTSLAPFHKLRVCCPIVFKGLVDPISDLVQEPERIGIMTVEYVPVFHDLVEFHLLPDQFLDAGAVPTLHDRYGLSTPEIIKAVKSWL